MTFEDRFQLEVPLGESPHGAVWSGKETQNQKPVAVALLDGDADDVTRARMQALIDGDVASVRAMTLARVVDAGLNAEGLPYIVTELLADAPSLTEKLESGPAVTVDIATRCVLDLLGAITKLEQAGLSHGDIEPGNVRVVTRGARLSPRLIGLGLNRAAIREGEHGLDSPEHLATLGYMAPEQAEGAPGGTSADVFSAIALLYSWISGRPPFRGADAAAVREAAGTLHVPRLGSVREGLAGTALAAVIDKALSRDPADRYDDIATLTAKLRESLLQGKETRELEVIVGPRATQPDASDAELSEERATGPTAAGSASDAGPAKLTSSSSLTIPGPAKASGKPATSAPGKLSLPKPSLPKPSPSKPSLPKPSLSKPSPSKPSPSKPSLSKPSLSKPSLSKPSASKPDATNEELAPEPGLAAAGAEDERDPDEVAFEKISGLLMIEEDAAPKRVQPRPAPPPPPGTASDGPAMTDASSDDAANELEADADAPASSDEEAPGETPALDEQASSEARGGDAAADDAGAEPDAPERDARPLDDAADALFEELEAATAADADPAARGAPGDAPDGAAAAEAEPAAGSELLSFDEPQSLDESQSLDDDAAASDAEPPAASVPLLFDDDDLGVDSVPGSEPLSFDDGEPAGFAAPVATHDEDDYVIPGGGPPWKIISAGAVLATALIGVAVWAWTKSHEHPALEANETTSVEVEVADVEPSAPPEQEAPTDTPDEEPVEAEAPEEAEPLLVSLTGVPEGAVVSVDGETIEGTEVSVVNESHAVEVRADGFEPFRATVDAETGARLAVELVPAEAEPDEEPEEEADELEDEPEETLTPAQIRRRERRRQQRRERREARRRGGSTSSLIAPNPF